MQLHFKFMAYIFVKLWLHSLH